MEGISGIDGGVPARKGRKEKKRKEIGKIGVENGRRFL